jgi:hypothetical protein
MINCALVSCSASWSVEVGNQAAQKSLEVEEYGRRESLKNGETLHGDEHKEIQRITEVIAKKILIWALSHTARRGWLRP